MSAQPPVILDVEDDPSQQNLVRIVLARQNGYQVLTAGDGFLALEIARTSTPDLLVLDYDLPGMNGDATLRALRELPGMQHVPAIFVTAAKEPEVHAALMALGALEILAKPLRPSLLVQAVKRHLGKDGD